MCFPILESFVENNDDPVTFQPEATTNPPPLTLPPFGPDLPLAEDNGLENEILDTMSNIYYYNGLLGKEFHTLYNLINRQIEERKTNFDQPENNLNNDPNGWGYDDYKDPFESEKATNTFTPNPQDVFQINDTNGWGYDDYKDPFESEETTTSIPNLQDPSQSSDTNGWGYDDFKDPFESEEATTFIPDLRDVSQNNDTNGYGYDDYKDPFESEETTTFTPNTQDLSQSSDTNGWGYDDFKDPFESEEATTTLIPNLQDVSQNNDTVGSVDPSFDNLGNDNYEDDSDYQ